MLSVALRDDRGQALVEWVVFMPCLIMMLFAIIFFSRLSVLGERSQSAVRYGDMVSFRSGNAYTVATVESVIDEILHSNANELGPLCLEPTSGATPSATLPPLLVGTVTGVYSPSLPAYTPMPQNTSVANRVAADTQAALVLAQNPGGGASPSAYASAKPYWRPDSVTTANCNPASIALQSGAYGAGNLPVSVQTVSISSSLNIPSYIAPYIMNGETSAKMGFLNVATPNVLLGCVPGLSIALSILQPSVAGHGGPTCPGAPTGS